MTGFEPIFIDSVSFIYLVENNPEFYNRVQDFFIEEFKREIPLITSVITISEFSVRPFKDNDTELLNDFQIVLDTFHISVLDINRFIATSAGKLRSKYHSLKTVDALQLASGIHVGCKRFLTNDIRLKQVSEIEVVLIKDL